MHTAIFTYNSYFKQSLTSPIFSRNIVMYMWHKVLDRLKHQNVSEQQNTNLERAIFLCIFDTSAKNGIVTDDTLCSYIMLD